MEGSVVGDRRWKVASEALAAVGGLLFFGRGWEGARRMLASAFGVVGWAAIGGLLFLGVVEGLRRWRSSILFGGESSLVGGGSVFSGVGG